MNRKDKRFAAAAEAAPVPVDGAVRAGGDHGLRHRPEPAEARGRRLIGVSGQWTLDNYAQPAGTSVIFGRIWLNTSEAGRALTTAAVRPDRLPLRLPDGPR